MAQCDPAILFLQLTEGLLRSIVLVFSKQNVVIYSMQQNVYPLAQTSFSLLPITSGKLRAFFSRSLVESGCSSTFPSSISSLSRFRSDTVFLSAVLLTVLDSVVPNSDLHKEDVVAALWSLSLIFSGEGLRSLLSEISDRHVSRSSEFSTGVSQTRTCKQ